MTTLTLTIRPSLLLGLVPSRRASWFLICFLGWRLLSLIFHLDLVIWPLCMHSFVVSHTHPPFDSPSHRTLHLSFCLTGIPYSQPVGRVYQYNRIYIIYYLNPCDFVCSEHRIVSRMTLICFSKQKISRWLYLVCTLLLQWKRADDMSRVYIRVEKEVHEGI